jgi:quercetin dioxygenase-like cupin family protein
MTSFARLGDVKPFDIVEGVRARPLFGDRLMFNLLDLDPGAGVPLHSHPHEQMGLVLEGELVFTAEGRERVLGPGDAFQVTSGVEHSAIAGPDGCRLLDVFSPVREDYRERASG